MDELEDESSLLKFAPFHSAIDEGFWHRFSSLKLNELGIDDSPIPITGFYAPCTHSQVSSPFTLLSESFDAREIGPHSWPESSRRNRNRCPIPGTLYNMNTFEAYKSVDKKMLIKNEAHKVWEVIHSGLAVEDTAVLLKFFIISFADLKNWTFHYWFAFPALMLDPPAKLIELKHASQWFSFEEAISVSEACNEWRNSNLTAGIPFFFVHFDTNSHATLGHLKELETCQCLAQKVLFGFYDQCYLPHNPGWPLRNLLALICSRWNLRHIFFFCYRENRCLADMNLSLVGEAIILFPQEWRELQFAPKSVGWELHKGRPASRCVNLSNSMDPNKLAVTAADLNLKLMRWRALPSLDLDKLSSIKCLLIGAGTLGCQVARVLMSWGIRRITLLDKGKVSMSNPLRQSLYTFSDCLNGGEFKAVASVESLKRIFPAVDADAVVMAIPMPGHPISNGEEDHVVNECRRLQDLVDSHDAIFLLTDTRESRWLPSLLCAHANKTAITAALGFDSFLVMRHGPGPFSNLQDVNDRLANSLPDKMDNIASANQRGQRLGCYFCNDVVAPTDSATNRTLDQQCTVTRPGLAPIASALAVELLVNLAHHPDGVHAGEISSSSNSQSLEHHLGFLPHQIRGFLYDFSQLIFFGYSSNTCTACSPTVVLEYQKRGIEFLLQAINNPTYLEDLAGLTELKKSTNFVVLDWTEDPDGEGERSEEHESFS